MPYRNPRDPDPRENRLPVWAQDTINDLRRRLADAEASVEQARLATDPDQSDTVIDRFGDKPIGLGTGTEITFRTSPARVRGSEIRVRLDSDGRLRILGDQRLAVFPTVTNAVEIKLVDR